MATRSRKPGAKIEKMNKYEASEVDKKLDKSGKHGTEGSKKDVKKDKGMMKKVSLKNKIA